MVSGLAVLAVLSGIIAYLAAALVWRLWIGNKWRRRQHRAAHPL
jgi:uncharacterized protein (DUF2062 family)